MKDPIVDKEKDEEKLEKKILKELRLDGVVNAREEVVRHLDREISGNSLVVRSGEIKTGVCQRHPKQRHRKSLS